MTQCLNSGSATYGISNDAGWGNGNLETFLKKFVAEAQYAKNVKKPFVFSFKVPEGGHSVVVCGYKKDTDGNHEITIYDENSYHPGSFGGYLTMKVSSDYKWFHFADSNSRFDDVCVEDLWTNLSYYGVDKIYNGGIQILKMKNKTAASMNIAALTNTTTSAYTAATTQTRQPSTEKLSKLKTQTIKTAKIKTYKAKNLKRKKATFNLKARSLGKAKLTYKVAGYPKKAKKYITVTKNGKVTLKKKAKKGTYKIQITAQKTSQYQKAVKYVTVKVK